METRLKFVITKKNGEKVEQEIGVPATLPSEKVQEFIQAVFLQYANIGMVRKDGNKFILLTASQIETVEVEIPTVVIASPGEILDPNATTPPGSVTLG